ncbi:hypothetical protein [Alteromonas sp. H39]|uniref:hypothetical protein n=1 Tax=Alteromonas sp. H39 TaxID=3389876 RepID=UPI0039E0398F
MTTLTFDNFQSPARDLAPPVQTHSVKKVLFFSLLLHIALVVVIASQPGPPPASEAKPAPINARLFFHTLPQPDVNDISPTSATPGADSSSAQTERVVSQKDTGPDLIPGTVSDPDDLTTTPVPAVATEPTGQTSELPNQVTEEPARRISLGDINAAREILRQQQAEAIERDARQAAAKYQRLKTQPEIIDPRKGREDEEPEIKPVEVNCEDTAKSILTTISGWAGGTLKCSKRNGFEKFVEKRVKKEN